MNSAEQNYPTELNDYTEAAARELDQRDPGQRTLFHIPAAAGGAYPEVAYFSGNSLGLQPRATTAELLEDLTAWAELGARGHTTAPRPWLSYQQLLVEPTARLVGARPSEVVTMNGLTVNLHLLMATFYRPHGPRRRIVIEDAAFSSDSYAVRSQLRWHGLDPDSELIRIRPRPGEDTLRTEDVIAAIDDQVALVLLGGVNYLTGEFLDIPAITAATRQAGAISGWDLAHAAGNVPLHLHEWEVDFAAWCSYKYLNSGPGAVAGVFVHERHHGTDLPRLEGWWSNETASRFDMTPVSQPFQTAEAWQVSNPPIFAMGPVRTSLEIFDKVGMPALRERSLRLTGYLENLFDRFFPGRALKVITPRDPAHRGAQLSVRVGGMAIAQVSAKLHAEYGVIADARRPDVLRFAPVPLYSTYHDCWRAAQALAEVVQP